MFDLIKSFVYAGVTTRFTVQSICLCSYYFDIQHSRSLNEVLLLCTTFTLRLDLYNVNRFFKMANRSKQFTYYLEEDTRFWQILVKKNDTISRGVILNYPIYHSQIK